MAELKECAHLVESVAEYLDSKCRIWKETLDRAYKDGKYNHNTGLWETDECKVSRARYTLDAYRDALSRVDTLGQQIDELGRRSAPSTAPLTCKGCKYADDVLRDAQIDPLTLEELRKMDGDPVWIKVLVAKPLSKELSQWVIILGQDESKIFTSATYLSISLYGKTWLPYRVKPEEDE